MDKLLSCQLLGKAYLQRLVDGSKNVPYSYRYPLDNPVITSFGAMNNRPLLLLKVSDNNGIEGWGEIWCNFH